jgi:hypothetical protein
LKTHNNAEIVEPGRSNKHHGQAMDYTEEEVNNEQAHFSTK